MRSGGEHGARRVGLAERGQRPLRGLRTVDHDGAERLAERGLDGLLPAGVDLDQIEQRAEHTVDVGEPFGAGAGVGGVERELQRFDPGVPREVASEAS
jgi:hypothetical protein